MTRLHWKTARLDQPHLVRLIMSSNFKNPLGVYVLASIFLLPAALAILLHPAEPLAWVLSDDLAKLLVAVLVGGRLFGLLAESWFVLYYVQQLLHMDPHQQSGRPAGQEEVEEAAEE